MAFEGIVNATEHKTEDGNKHYTVEMETSNNSDKEIEMNDIAGLMALMQNNMSKDLPGMLALCKDRGYDGQQWWWIIILLFVLGGGNLGWGNNRGIAAGLIGAENLQMITSMYDRIADAKSATTEGFANLNSHLCESIATVISSVRNQGDRAVDATQSLNDTVRNCCCTIENMLSTLNCKVDGVSRDIRETSNLINAKVELEALKAENARAAMECRITQNQKDCCCELNRRFDQLECTIQTNRLADENARLARENESLRSTVQGNALADATVARMQSFVINHYTPTRTTTTTTTPAA